MAKHYLIMHSLIPLFKHFVEKALLEKKEKLTDADSIYINNQLDFYLGKVPF
ncbi:MAG: hypothetical protein WDM90_16800 [Ferruginibacter sp.]